MLMGYPAIIVLVILTVNCIAIFMRIWACTSVAIGCSNFYYEILVSVKRINARFLSCIFYKDYLLFINMLFT